MDAHAEALVVSDGGLQEGDGADCFFVRLDLGEGDPGVVVDTDTGEFPALVAASSLTGAIAGDAVTDLGEAGALSRPHCVTGPMPVHSRHQTTAPLTCRDGHISIVGTGHMLA